MDHKLPNTIPIFPLSNLDKNVENLLKSGFRSKKKNLEDWVLKAIGKILI